MRSEPISGGETFFTQQYNSLRSDAFGASNLLVHQMLGTLALGTNASNTNTLTLTVNGTAITITFVTSIGATAGNVLIGASAAATCANLMGLLNNPNITSTTQVALSANNQLLISYLNFELVGTNIIFGNDNSTIYAPNTSFTASTTVSAGTWTAQTMKLFVEPGIAYVNGTEVYFAGGSTPTVTAPSSHPRIDVLTIDSSGTLAWTTGSENASPTTPAYPANKIALIELYNVTGETQLLDFANQSSSQGYVYNDVRSFLQYVQNPTAFASNLIPDGDGTRNLGSPSFEWENVYAKTAVIINGTALTGPKFGGTGADGALSVSSGNTNIDCANAAVVVKNYTSVSITGTGSVTFINPHANGTLVIVKSQTGVTLTSSATPMLSAAGMGAAGGASVSLSSGSAGGNPGNPGLASIFQTNAGGGATTGVVGSGGAVPIASYPTAFSQYLLKYAQVLVGAGGGSGMANSNASAGTATSGAGGRGGGGLIIECAGAWNFTTTSGISVAGTNGTNATATSTSFAGGSGGGSGGLLLVLYNALTANSGTVTSSGGTGSNSKNTSGNTTYGAGGGGFIAAGNAGTSSTADNTKTGGDGAAGISLIALNTEFA